jgi:hypothetical protein
MGNKGKKQKIPLPLPPQKEKNWTIHECMMSLPIGYMKFLFPKLFPIIIFWPGLIAGSVIWGHNQTCITNYCDMVGPSLVFSHAFLCVHPFVFALNDLYL